MKRILLFTLALLLCAAVTRPTAARETKAGYSYQVSQQPWDEALGTHRAVLRISQPAEVVSLDLRWRRHDAEVANRCFIIKNATTGEAVANIRRIEVNADHCSVQFGPVKEAGDYDFYYLPFETQNGSGYYSKSYLPKEKSPEAAWLRRAEQTNRPTAAEVLCMECRTAIDDFYPMEIVASDDEVKSYRSKNRSALYLFPEDRKYPIRMRDRLPLRWMTDKQGRIFRGEAAPNEYYAFQIGVWAADRALTKISYRASDFTNGRTTLPASAVTCFNTEGIDSYGVPFRKEVNVKPGAVQALWFGIDIPEQAETGEYRGSVTVSDGSGAQAVVPVRLTVKGTVLSDRGDSETWRHSRLRWLNSTLGIADTPIKPYTSMTLQGNEAGCLGRTVTVDPATAMPRQIRSWGHNLLSSPVRFEIVTVEGVKQMSGTFQSHERTDGHVSGTWTAEDSELTVRCSAVMEFDGWMHYRYEITPKQALTVKDIRMVLPVKNEIASYFLGAGLPGQEIPREYDGNWNGPERIINSSGTSIPTDAPSNRLLPFDSFWTGNAHAGIHCELRGTTYSGPLLNLYHPAFPPSWNNDGKGGFKIRRGDTATEVTTYSGERTLKAGAPITFDFALLITPVKPLDMKGQFVNRYYHNGQYPVPNDSDIEAGVKIINVHHANEFNPYINYPFLSVDKMRGFADTWHAKGCKVKIYYTLRELSTAMTELWAMRSLGDEILRGGDGGGYPWLREHLVTDYTPQWYHHFEGVDVDIAADAAILTAESDSRLYNYYVEGLRWIIRNLHVDGLYLDDVSFDRRILKRMRRAMESVKPGCIIDLHSNTGFSKGPANQYAEFFPYVDKLWFGESFRYDQMTAANWLVESSGIPFGLTGDMLQGGGNKWLGMQYGMTARHPWLTEGVVCDPRIVWELWDAFGIADSQMIGYWEPNDPVTASDPDVKVTVYKKTEKTLLSIGNYSDTPKTVHLTFDWQALGLDGTKATLTAPAVRAFQDAATWQLDDAITVAPRKGWLIYVQ